MAKRDAEAERWEEWTSKEAYRQLAPAPLVEPLRRLCVSKRRGWCRRSKDTLQKVVVDGGWAQSRLPGAGLIEEAACLGCQEEEVTLHHLYFVCKATRDR